MAFTIEEARAVNTLLDYYEQSDWTRSEAAAIEAWERLAASAHDRLGAGWRVIDVAKSIRPAASRLSQYSTDDEDCDACTYLDDQCPFHVGIEHGMQVVRRAVNALAVNPELLNEVLDSDATTQRCSADYVFGAQHPEVITVPITSFSVAVSTQEALPGSELVVRLVHEGDDAWLRYSDGEPVAVRTKP